MRNTVFGFLLYEYINHVIRFHIQDNSCTSYSCTRDKKLFWIIDVPKLLPTLFKYSLKQTHLYTFSNKQYICKAFSVAVNCAGSFFKKKIFFNIYVFVNFVNWENIFSCWGLISQFKKDKYINRERIEGDLLTSLNFLKNISKKIILLKIVIHVKIENKYPSIYFCGHVPRNWEGGGSNYNWLYFMAFL